jgi:hypothetical protein
MALLGMSLLASGWSQLKSKEQANSSLQPTFQPGQIWKYKTAPGEEGATLLILRIEIKEKKGNVVHVRVDNVPVPCGNLNITTTYEHVAVSERALRQSTIELITNVGELPQSYLKGWHESYPGTVDSPLSKISFLPASAGLICQEARQHAAARKQ